MYNRRIAIFLVAAGVSILLFGSLVACQATQGAAAGSNGPQPNSPVETASISTPTPEPLPTEKPHKTVEEIENTWEANGYLDRTHLALGTDCRICHNQEWPPQGPPDKKVCLDCHGGSYDVIAAQTARDPNPHEVNIHNLDLDQVACSTCHVVHEPFVDPCSECH